MNKISTQLYLLLSVVIYFGMILLNTFVITTFDLTYKIILTLIFAPIVFLHFAFFQTHYDEILSYTLFKKVLLVILSFVYLVTLNLMVRFKMISQINIIILFNSCTLVFPMLMTMISVLIPNKMRWLSRIIYYCGIVELFAGGIASIISLYYPDLFIKG